MAVGDSGDMLRRLKSLVPAGWFADAAPLRDVVFGGLSDGLAWIWSVLQIAKAATRRATTTGRLLDVDAFGFFGATFLRRTGESDDAWRRRYTDEIFRPRVTRDAISKALFDATGRAPIIVEPWNPGDCGGWDTGYLAWSGAQVSGGPVGGYDSPFSGWDVGSWGFDLKATQSLPGSTGAGCWGSLEMPFQMFVTAYRQLPDGVPYVGGWDTGAGGWGAGMLAWVGSDLNEITAPDEEIYAAINRTKAAGVTVWTQIQD